MSEKLLSDLSRSHAAIVDETLRLQRMWLLALATIGGLSAFPALPYLFSNPNYPVHDAIMQVANGVILLAAALGIFIVPVRYTRKVALVVFVLVMLDLTIRVILAHHLEYPENVISPEEIMVQFAPMIPAVLVACFLFLSFSAALTLSSLMTAITAGSVLVYQLTQGASAWDDFHRLGVVLQFLFAHPVLIILLVLLNRVSEQYRAYAEFALNRAEDIERQLLRDESGLLLTRPAILQLLRDRLEKRQYDVSVLSVKILKGDVGDEHETHSTAELRNTLVEVAGAMLPESATLGFYESDQLLVVSPITSDETRFTEQLMAKWQSLGNRTELEVRKLAFSPGMTWPIFANDLENVY